MELVSLVLVLAIIDPEFITHSIWACWPSYKGEYSAILFVTTNDVMIRKACFGITYSCCALERKRHCVPGIFQEVECALAIRICKGNCAEIVPKTEQNRTEFLVQKQNRKCTTNKTETESFQEVSRIWVCCPSLKVGGGGGPSPIRTCTESVAKTESE